LEPFDRLRERLNDILKTTKKNSEAIPLPPTFSALYNSERELQKNENMVTC